MMASATIRGISDGLPFPDFAHTLPAADRASFTGLCNTRMQERALARAEQYRRFALALLSIYNSLAPIHRLPFEVLSVVFAQSWDNRRSLRLAHVCRRWRSVLLNTPEFWADAVNSHSFDADQDHLDYLRAVLKRSSPHKIEPWFSGFSPSITTHLVSHAARIVFLQVTLFNKAQFSGMWDALTSGMHALESLVIVFEVKNGRSVLAPTSWFRSVGTNFRPLLEHHCPNLRHLCAPGSLFNLLALPSLQEVTLGRDSEGSMDSRIASTAQFRDAISCCPRLHTLKLLKVSPGPFSQGPIAAVSQSAVLLPNLQHLFIEDFANRISTALSCIRVPSATHTHLVDITRPNDPIPRVLGLQAALPAHPDALHAILPAIIDRVEICQQSKKGSVQCYTDDTELLRFDCIQVGVESLGRAFGARTHVTQLAFTLDEPNLLVDFAAFPHVTRLELRGTSAIPMLGRLEPGEDNGQGPGEVVCPALTDLIVRFEFRGYSIMVKALQGLGRGGQFETVVAHMNTACDFLGHVLTRRSSLGSRLTRLKFGFFEEQPPPNRSVGPPTNEPVMSESKREKFKLALEPLRELVDDIITFEGFYFYDS